MFPSDESLSASQYRSLPEYAVFRLEVYLKIVVIDGTLHILYQSRLIYLFIMEIPVIKSQRPCIVASQPVTGKLCVIKPLLRAVIYIDIFIYADTQPYLCIREGDRTHFLCDPVRKKAIIIHSGIEYIECVCSSTAGDPQTAMKLTFKYCRHFFKNVIALITAVDLIYQMEVFYIHNYGIHPAFVILNQLFDIFKEKVIGIKTG